MQHNVYRYEGGRFSRRKIHVVNEVPFRILVNDRELATLMCTPVKLRELTLGFLAFERLIDSLADVKNLEIDEDEFEAYVQLARPFTHSKRRILTSGCAGGITFHLDINDYALIRTEVLLEPAQISPLTQQLSEASYLYHQSRGVHASALSDGEKLVAIAEDVGRHNTVDKLRGEALERGIDTQSHILVSSGRISSEMLRKAAQMRIPFVVSRTSPTSISISLAKRLGITLIGYVRLDEFTVYSHPEGIAVGESSARERICAVAPSRASIRTPAKT